MPTKKKTPAKKGVSRKKKPATGAESKPESGEDETFDTSRGTALDVAADESEHPIAHAQPEFTKFEVAKRIAHTLANSSLVPDAYRQRPNDVFVAINMGAEIGLEPFQAIQSIAVIDGKPCLYGDGLIGVVRASPLCEWIEETIAEDGLSATCSTKRRGDRKPIDATYTMEDAKLAGIDTRTNWRKHPKRMLQMRARAYCLRNAYPDVLKGLGVFEELIDHENTPAPIQDYTLPTPPEQQTPSPAVETGPTLAEVERAIQQSDTMNQLLAAGQLAAQLKNPHEVATARLTYKRWRNVLMERQPDAGEQ